MKKVLAATRKPAFSMNRKEAYLSPVRTRLFKFTLADARQFLL